MSFLRFIKRGINKILQQQDGEGYWYDIPDQDEPVVRKSAHMLSDDQIHKLVTDANVYLINKRITSRVESHTYTTLSGIKCIMFELKFSQNGPKMVVSLVRTMATPARVNRILNEFCRAVQDHYGWEEKDLFVKTSYIRE